MQNFTIVNNTGIDLDQYKIREALVKVVRDGAEVPEEIADLFKVEILRGYNADGSDRGIVDWA